MAKPIEVTDSNFEQEVVNSDIPVIVDFWAIWCGPCKMIEPIMEEFAREYDGKVKIASLDVDHNPNIAVKYGIRSIPTVLLFKDGKIIEQIIGAYPKSYFQDKITKIL